MNLRGFQATQLHAKLKSARLAALEGPIKETKWFQKVFSCNIFANPEDKLQDGPTTRCCTNHNTGRRVCFHYWFQGFSIDQLISIHIYKWKNIFGNLWNLENETKLHLKLEWFQWHVYFGPQFKFFPIHILSGEFYLTNRNTPLKFHCGNYFILLERRKNRDVQIVRLLKKNKPHHILFVHWKHIVDYSHADNDQGPSSTLMPWGDSTC